MSLAMSNAVALRSFIIADGGRKFHEVSVKMILTISLFLNCIGFQKNTQISPPFLQKNRPAFLQAGVCNHKVRRQSLRSI